MRLTEHFTREELACKCGCDRMEIPGQFLQDLERFRQDAGFSFVISSGYRCPKHNAEVSSTGSNGPHTKAAVDIRVFGKQALTLMALALDSGIWTGIGVNQKGQQGQRFIHVDQLGNEPGQPRPWVWTY